MSKVPFTEQTPQASLSYLKRVGDTIFVPPCHLKDVVHFKDGVCPYSNEKDCRDCIPNRFAEECVNMLRCSEKFWWV